MAHWEWVCPLPGWLWGILQFKVAVSKRRRGAYLVPSPVWQLLLVSSRSNIPGSLWASFLYMTTAFLQPSLSQQAFQPPIHWVQSTAQPESK